MTSPTSPDEEVAPVVAVGRTIGGGLLVVIGLVLIIAGALWYFILPWVGFGMEGFGIDGFWYQMAEWADLGGIAVGVLGFLLAIVGGALIQRARKRKLQIFIDPKEAMGLTEAEESPAPGTTPPTTIL